MGSLHIVLLWVLVLDFNIEGTVLEEINNSSNDLDNSSNYLDLFKQELIDIVNEKLSIYTEHYTFLKEEMDYLKTQNSQLFNENIQMKTELTEMKKHNEETSREVKNVKVENTIIRKELDRVDDLKSTWNYDSESKLKKQKSQFNDSYVSFRAFPSRMAQNFTNKEILVFDSVMNNYGEAYLSQNSTFICPKDSFYIFTVTVFTTRAGKMRAHVLLEGETIHSLHAYDDYTHDQSTGVMVTPCLKGQRVWVEADVLEWNGESYLTLYGLEFSFFSGTMIDLPKLQDDEEEEKIDIEMVTDMMKDMELDNKNRFNDLETQLAELQNKYNQLIPRQDKGKGNHQSGYISFRAEPSDTYRYTSGDIAQFDLVRTNYGNAYLNSNSTFICPYNGFYLFTLTCLSDYGHWIRAGLMLEGTILHHVYAHDQDHEQATAVVVNLCEVGQRVWVQIWGDEPDLVMYANQHSSFAATLLAYHSPDY